MARNKVVTFEASIPRSVRLFRKIKLEQAAQRESFPQTTPKVAAVISKHRSRSTHAHTPHVVAISRRQLASGNQWLSTIPNPKKPSSASTPCKPPPRCLTNLMTPLLSYLTQHPLIRQTIKPATEKKYAEALDSFQNSLTVFPTSLIELDEALLDFIESKFSMSQTRGTRQKMCNLLCAIYLIAPSSRKALGLSERALKGWNISKPPVASTPLTKDITLAIAGYLMHQEDPKTAFALVIAWAGYLRASEVLSLTWDLIALPGDPRLSSYPNGTAGVCVKDTKTGPFQFIPITHREAVVILRVYRSRFPAVLNPGHKLFAFSYNTYQKRLQSACVALGLDDFKITTHSARIGGALHDFWSGKSAETIAIIGRWKSLSFLRYYLTNGRAWIMKLELKSETKTTVKNYSDWFAHLCSNSSCNRT